MKPNPLFESSSDSELATAEVETRSNPSKIDFDIEYERFHPPKRGYNEVEPTYDNEIIKPFVQVRIVQPYEHESQRLLQRILEIGHSYDETDYWYMVWRVERDVFPGQVWWDPSDLELDAALIRPPPLQQFPEAQLAEYEFEDHLTRFAYSLIRNIQRETTDAINLIQCNPGFAEESLAIIVWSLQSTRASRESIVWRFQLALDLLKSPLRSQYIPSRHHNISNFSVEKRVMEICQLLRIYQDLISSRLRAHSFQQRILTLIETARSDRLLPSLIIDNFIALFSTDKEASIITDSLDGTVIQFSEYCAECDKDMDGDSIKFTA